jgi:flavorubredoxin
MGKNDKSDLVTEIFKSKGVVLGSSTINNGVLGDVAAMLDIIKGLKFKNKIGAAFGSYGWSGESVKIIETKLKEAGIEITAEGIKAQYNPTPEEIKACEVFGEAFAEKVLAF